MQNDAEDFASKLIDHLDTALSPPASSTSSSSSSERSGNEGNEGNEGKGGSRGKGRNTNNGPRHLMNGTVFGGRNIHITDRRAGGCPHVSERREPFVCLDIEVQVNKQHK
jgi:hypothetical protein